MSNSLSHVPVLIKEIHYYLALQQNDNVIDGTVGYGGHSEMFLEAVAPTGKVVGIDLDGQALRSTKERFDRRDDFIGRYSLIHDNYHNIKKIVASFPELKFHRILLDLGLSSPQVEDENRGFGYKTAGVLDMRFDDRSNNDTLTAKEILNTWTEKELAHIFEIFGEEPLAKLIARTIVSRRKIHSIDTPSMLVKVVSDVYHIAPFKLVRLVRGKHPARKVFQALRIAVNQELENLSKFLEDACEVLPSGGRLAIISYHSLEDRLVKNFFKTHQKKLKKYPRTTSGELETSPFLTIITKKPLKPKEEEVKQNPRARSAKLRVAEKL